MKAPIVTGEGLAVIVGSGIPEDVSIAAPDAFVVERHGPERAVPAHLVDHHRNIAAICEQGADRVLAISSVGSLRLDWPAGTVVCPDDLLAPGFNPTYFDDVSGHQVPGFDCAWRDTLIRAWSAVGGEIQDGGVYAQMAGPRFETPAEVRMLATHADVVGMTVASEAILAGEAGLAYAAICVVDNLANGLGGHELSIDDLQRAREQTARAVVAILGLVLADLAD